MTQYSTCCFEPVEVAGDTTKFYVCTSCKKATDITNDKSISEAVADHELLSKFLDKAMDKANETQREIVLQYTNKRA